MFFIHFLVHIFSRANGPAATTGGIAPGQTGVDAEEVAPAGQFVECTLLIALADVAFYGTSGSDEVEIVEDLVIEADTEAVVVEVLYAPVDVGTLEDGLVEGLLHVMCDGV